MTRLRFKLKDPSKFNAEQLKQGAGGHQSFWSALPGAACLL